MKLLPQPLLSYINKTVLIAILVITQSNLCMMPGMPSGQNFAPQGPQIGGQGGGMQMPSDAELEAMFKEIEKIAAENPEIIKEWEREGQRAIMAMSDAELNEFSQMMGLNPAELREEAAKALAGESMPQVQPEPLPIKNKPQEKTPDKPIEKPIATASKSDITNIERTIQELINNLSRIQQAASSVREVYEMVRSWSQELRDLMFHLRVINTDKHYNQLARPEFKNLLKILTQLKNDIALELPNLILPDDLSRENTPYDLLGLSPKASDTEITAAYEKLAQVNNPKELEKNLRTLGTQEENIKRLIKAARINFEIIEEAYEQLSDIKLRKQLDRTIEAEKKLHKQKLECAITTIATIAESFSRAIYTKQLLTELEKFLQTYAPQEAALKKQMDEAEKKRKEEQKKREGMRATETPGRYEQNVSYKPAPSSSNDYGYYSDFPSYGGNDRNNYQPDYSYGDTSSDDNKKQSDVKDSGAAQKPAEKTNEEKEKNEKVSKDIAEKQATQKKSGDIDSRSVSQLMSDIEKECISLVKNYGQDPEGVHNKMIISNFETYAKQKPGDVITHADYKPESQRDMTAAEDLMDPKKLLENNLEITDSTTNPKKVSVVTKKAVTAQVEPIRSNYLQELEKNLKIDKLSKDLEILSKKVKVEKTKLNSEQEKAWKKITELYEKPKKSTATASTTKTYIKPSLDEISKKIGTAFAVMAPEKQEAHQEAVETFLSTIKSINDIYSALTKKFEE